MIFDQNTYSTRGFTLIEMMVAVSLFAIVMTISIGALLDMVSANRKAQAMQSVMNNLNIALDGMVRNVRMGTDYHCGGGTLSQKLSCPSGDQTLAFESFGGNPNTATDQWIYWIEGNRLYKSEDAKATRLAITAPEIQIDDFKVYVTGATQSLNDFGEAIQPKVVFVIKGTAAAAGNTNSVVGTADKTRSTFTIQAVATQRILDL